MIKYSFVEESINEYTKLPDVLCWGLFFSGSHGHCSGYFSRHKFLQGQPSFLCVLLYWLLIWSLKAWIVFIYLFGYQVLILGMYHLKIKKNRTQQSSIFKGSSLFFVSMKYSYINKTFLYSFVSIITELKQWIQIIIKVKDTVMQL